MAGTRPRPEWRGSAWILLNILATQKLPFVFHTSEIDESDDKIESSSSAVEETSHEWLLSRQLRPPSYFHDYDMQWTELVTELEMNRTCLKEKYPHLGLVNLFPVIFQFH